MVLSIASATDQCGWIRQLKLALYWRIRLFEEGAEDEWDQEIQPEAIMEKMERPEGEVIVSSSGQTISGWSVEKLERPEGGVVVSASAQLNTRLERQLIV